MLLILVAETTIRLAIDEAVKSNSFCVEEYNFRIVVRYALEEMRITYVEVGGRTQADVRATLKKFGTLLPDINGSTIDSPQTEAQDYRGRVGMLSVTMHELAMVI